MTALTALEYRNVIARQDGAFDCEIDHPQFGWIPFTADPNDVEPHGRAIWAAINEAQGNPSA